MAPRILCDLFPSLCKKKGVVGSVSHPRKELRWRWLNWWAETLYYADELPTLQQLEVLASACLNAGYPENALEIVTVLLDEESEFARDIDVLTKVNLQLIGVRAAVAVALEEQQQAIQLLEDMPPREVLIEAVRSKAQA